MGTRTIRALHHGPGDIDNVAPSSPSLPAFLASCAYSNVHDTLTVFFFQSRFLSYRNPQVMSNTPNPLFKFSREGFSVRVNNIADAGALSRRSTVAMCLATALLSLASGDSGLVQQPNWCVFITLITCTRVNLEARLSGDIVRCEEMYDRGRRYYLLTFATQDSAK